MEAEAIGARTISPHFERRLEELIGARIDAEDAIQIAEVAAGEGGIGKKTLIDLMRTQSRRMDPAAFAILKEAVTGKGGSEAPDRLLLQLGNKGDRVGRLRDALGAAAKVLKDKRIDAGPGRRFDARCAVALRAFQTRMHLPVSGRLDSATLRGINYVLNESMEPLLDIDFPRRALAGVELHFYPGDQARRMVVRHRGQVVDVYDMRGGPAKTTKDGRAGVNPRFKWAPTAGGSYRLAGARAHISANWKFSQVPFGAELRMHEGQVEFRNPGSKTWQQATGLKSVFKNRPTDRQFSVEDFLVRGRLPERYVANDFGHEAHYLKNSRGRMVGHMIHASPRGERNYGNDQVALSRSHGCEHMRPADIDECVAKGYFRPGRSFKVHGYGEALPEDVAEFLALTPTLTPRPPLPEGEGE